MSAKKPKPKRGQGLTIKEVADHFGGVTVMTVRRWIKAGLFPNFTIEETPRGPLYRIPRSDVRAFKRPEMGRPKPDKKPAKLRKQAT